MDLNELEDSLQGQMMTCPDCRYLPGHHVVPCGWHENLVASMAAIAAAIRTMDTETSNDD